MSVTFEIRIKIDRIRKVSFENVFNPDKKQSCCIHWWEPRPARLNDPSHRKHDEISNSFFINRETQFPSFRSKDSGCAVDDSNRRSASYRLDPVSSKKMKSWRSKKVFFEMSSSLLIRTWFEERILLFKTKKRNNATRFRKFYSTKQNTSL